MQFPQSLNLYSGLRTTHKSRLTWLFSSFTSKRNTEKVVVLDPKRAKLVGVATRDKGRGTQNPGLDLKEETLHFTSQFPSMDLKIRE